MAKWTALCLVVVMTLSGCGAGEAKMSAAVTAVEPKLRTYYSYSYAGLEVEAGRLIIYRKPDARLDALVRELADVDVEFRDAPYALDALQPLVESVDGDGHYWITREFPVKLTVTRVDGTGVNVFVATEDLDAARAAFRERYGDEPIVVDRLSRHGIVPVKGRAPAGTFRSARSPRPPRECRAPAGRRAAGPRPPPA